MEADQLITDFTGQIQQIKSALRSILLLEKNISSATDSLDAQVAAAITQAFEEHAPGFRYDEQSNTPDGKFKVDNAVKSVCMELVKAAAESSQHVMQYCVQGARQPSIPQLLDLARYLSQILLADAVLFLGLLSDLVEACTVEEGTDIFLYLETCVPYMEARFNFEPQASAPKLAVLRVCNTLLRRLSRARHVLLAGRIHLFLSQALPSTDRSAVNANGMVNESHAVEAEDVAEGFLGTDGKPTDVTLYKQFWSLQQVFQNPTSATDPNLWLQVHASIKAVLAEFGKVRPTVVSSGINSGSGMGGEGEPEGLTVKYLSSPKLFNLQLRDAGFRRHFLVQCLTLLQACARKSLARQETFRIKQQGEADDLQEGLLKELERTPQHGLQFARTIRGLLHQEDQWADWKAGGAKSFERPRSTLEPAPPLAKRRRANPTDVVMLGTRELTRLWNASTGNAEAIKRESRKTIPSLREFLQPVLLEMDPDEGIEEQYKKKNEVVYRWEALRQIAKVSRVHLSSVVKTPGLDLEEACRLIFPADIPAAAAKAPEVAIALPDETPLGAPPSPGPVLLAPEKPGSPGAIEPVLDSAGGVSPAEPDGPSEPDLAGANGPERSATADLEGGPDAAAGEPEVVSGPVKMEIDEQAAAGEDAAAQRADAAVEAGPSDDQEAENAEAQGPENPKVEAVQGDSAVAGGIPGLDTEPP